MEYKLISKTLFILISLLAFNSIAKSEESNLGINKLYWDEAFIVHFALNYKNKGEANISDLIRKEEFPELWVLLYEPEKYLEFHNDEFSWEEIKAETRKEALEKIRTTKTDTVYTARFISKYGKYDFENNGFPINLKEPISVDILAEDATHRMTIYNDVFRGYGNKGFRFPSSFRVQAYGYIPQIISMNKEDAKELNKERKRNGSVDRKFYIELDYILVEVGERYHDYSSIGLELKADIKAIRYYLDDSFTNPIVSNQQ